MPCDLTPEGSPRSTTTPTSPPRSAETAAQWWTSDINHILGRPASPSRIRHAAASATWSTQRRKKKYVFTINDDCFG
ncbi:hypothetical protein GUJ93_ZPchr0010g8397 [Zizania palustris]|uniref:Uncharacterized protein n=1 Tax=Zizania palustris TaxID=103762 RepID=A0A8J5TMB8_ZIZPA|nr:hypothetical protein GUJ93_ZPchr0010g8397 [Zizania palustris]